MRLLLDTHALIWLLEGDPRMRPHLVERIAGAETAFVSLVSHWEMAIKVGLEKLEIKGPLSDYFFRLKEFGLVSLAPSFEDVERLVSLPQHHRDPFDRMLVAQAMTHGLTVVTKDQNIPLYGVPVLW